MITGGVSVPPFGARTLRDSDNWERILARLDYVKERIGYPPELKRAERLWRAFEGENQARPRLVLRLAEEVERRGVDFTQFF